MIYISTDYVFNGQGTEPWQPDDKSYAPLNVYGKKNVWGSVDSVPNDLTNEEIADVLFSFRKSVDLNYLQPDCEKILDKKRKGYLRDERWTEYCAEAGAKGKKAYKLSRFNEIVPDYRSRHDISFTMNHVPGLQAQADWTGDKGHFLDCDTRELVEVHVFAMTLPYSGYFYCESFLDEKLPSWYAGHSNAFVFYGGVPAFIIPDNIGAVYLYRELQKEVAIFEVTSCSSAVTDRKYKKLPQQVYENLDGQGCFDSVKRKSALAIKEAEGL